jgi:GNAT superfamily N-acetyltransferase
MEYELRKDYRSDDSLRHSLNALAGATFGLNFENWYQSGYWGEKYIPYSIVAGGEVVSNVSVNRIDCMFQGEERHYIQLGTVMTSRPFRGQGLCRKLIETVLEDYASCDGFFLYANDSVLDFYPRFGFRPQKEYRYATELQNKGIASAVRVPMETKEDWSRFLAEKNRRNGNGLLDMQTDELLMFYLTQSLRENVFFVPQQDAVVVAENDDGTLLVHAVYSTQPVDLKDVCGAFGKTVREVRFTFPPRDTAGLTRMEWNEEGTTFFLLGEGLRKDMETIGSFPVLVHA